MPNETMTVQRLYDRAHALALVTVCYNLLEGVVSIWFGIDDETLSLFGFGVDSFIEVISALGVWHMIRRIRDNQGETRDEFERRALRITGSAFHLLAAALVTTAVVNVLQGHTPRTTVAGIVISLVSISCMWLLIRMKSDVGRRLGSAAILADAACSRACMYLSLVLLAASLGYRLTGIGILDSLGALGIAWFSFREGREAFEKARGGECSCSTGCCGSKESVP